MDKKLMESIVVETVEKIVDHVEKKGDVTITHNILCEWIGTKETDRHYYGMVGRIKKILKKNFGLFLISDTKYGYKAVKRGEEIDVIIGKIERGKRLVHRGCLDTQYIDLTLIDDESKRNRTIEKTQSIKNLDLLIKSGTIRENKWLPAHTGNPLSMIPGYRQ